MGFPEIVASFVGGKESVKAKETIEIKG